MFEKLFVVGGVYGDSQLTISLIQHLDQLIPVKNRQFLSIQTIIGNEDAALQKRNYVHEDITKCFTDEQIYNAINVLNEENNVLDHIHTKPPITIRHVTQLTSERRRTVELFKTFKNMKEKMCCFLYSTPSNVGIVVQIDLNNKFLIQMFSSLKIIFPMLKIVEKNNALFGISSFFGELFFDIIIGNTHNNIIDGCSFKLLRKFVLCIFDYIELYNISVSSNWPKNIIQKENDIYKIIGTLDFPSSSENVFKEFFCKELVEFSQIENDQVLFENFDGTSRRFHINNIIKCSKDDVKNISKFFIFLINDPTLIHLYSCACFVLDRCTYQFEIDYEIIKKLLQYWEENDYSKSLFSIIPIGEYYKGDENLKKRRFDH